MIQKTTFKNGQDDYELIVALEIEKDFWKDKQKEGFKRLRGNLGVKGFRKGNVPVEMAKRYISDGQIYNEAISSFINKIAEEVVPKLPKTAEILSGPAYNLVKCDNEDLVIEFIYPTFPKIKLCDVKKLEVKYGDAFVSKDQIKDRIKQSQQSMAMTKKLDRVVKKGDTVIIDFIGYIGGEKFEGGAAKDFRFEVGSNKLLSDLENGIIGMKTGEVKKIDVTFPKDYMVPELREEKTVFEVTLKETQEVQIPEINNELALDLGIEGVSTIEDLEAHFEKEIAEENKHKVEQAFELDLINAIVKNSTIPVHDLMISSEMEKVSKEFEQDLKKQNINYNDYLKFSGATNEILDEQFRSEATDRLKRTFAIRQAIRDLNLSVVDKDYDEYIKDLASKFKITFDQAKSFFKKEQLTQPVLQKKAMAILKETFINGGKLPKASKSIEKSAPSKESKPKVVVEKKATTKESKVKTPPEKKVAIKESKSKTPIAKKVAKKEIIKKEIKVVDKKVSAPKKKAPTKPTTKKAKA